MCVCVFKQTNKIVPTKRSHTHTHTHTHTHARTRNSTHSAGEDGSKVLILQSTIDILTTTTTTTTEMLAAVVVVVAVESKRNGELALRHKLKAATAVHKRHNTKQNRRV